MKLSIVAGATSQSVNVFIQDSSSTTGAGLTGLLFNSSGFTAYYTFSGTNAAATSITLATLVAVNSAYSSGGFKEIDATNMPGWYRFDLPDAALATSKGRCVSVHLKGVTNMAPCPIEIELTGWNNQDGVHGGLTCLPNTGVTTNGSLITSGSGTDQLTVTAGIAKADARQWLGGTIPAVNVTGVPLIDLKYTLGTISPATAGSVRSDAVTGAVGSVTAPVSVTSNVKKNQALAGFTFTMTDSTNHNPTTGLTITPTVAHDGGAFASTTNAVTELANGDYILNLSAADLNANNVMLRFTATGADDLNILIVTQP